MKIKKVNEMQSLNEGLRVNTKLLTLYGKHTINDVLQELQKLQQVKPGDSPILGFFGLDTDYITDEIYTTFREVRSWQKEGWKSLEGFGTEWIPLSE